MRRLSTTLGTLAAAATLAIALGGSAQAQAQVRAQAREGEGPVVINGRAVFGYHGCLRHRGLAKIENHSDNPVIVTRGPFCQFGSPVAVIPPGHYGFVPPSSSILV
ncbi:hypothetical protein ABT084_21715 [Streptomyces sp. NPDC002138]|uniref:hypothetical protein n=1 Tax=Streptomyces sp. NPDC002138 TaxID=3154410 RepID=UPI003321DF91